MTSRNRRQESFEALQLRDHVTGTPCPHEGCPAHTNPQAPCANPDTGLPTRVPHIARITTATKDHT